MPKPISLEIIDPAAGEPRRMTFEPAAAPVTIGSAPTSVICLASRAVDAMHAELFLDGEHWCVRDCASLGGTFIDHNRLFITPIRLEIGQTIRLGAGDDAARFSIVAGAAEAREAVNVSAEVAGFVKTQKRERKKRRRWAIALPSAGLSMILGIWGVGTLLIGSDVADRRAHPERYAGEDKNAAVERLASIMAGEARPEDVDVKEIIAAASFGRTSKLADQALSLVKPGAGVPASAGTKVASMKTVAAQPTQSQGPTVKAVDEQSVAALIELRRKSGPDAELDARLAEESRILTLRRLRKLLDERQAALESTSDAATSPRFLEIDRRLIQLGVNASKLNWRQGEDIDALAKKLDPAVVDKIRQRVVSAMSAH